MSESRYRLIGALFLLVVLIAGSTFGLMVIEGLSAFDALWLTVISISTTGYGDVVPKTVNGKAFLMGVLVTSLVVVAYSMGSIVNMLVAKQLLNQKRNSKMTRAIEKLSGHVIVCGAGRVGGNVIDILRSEGASYVVIESNQELADRMRAAGHLVLLGDATRDELLHEAGIRRAKGIICGLANDAYNVYVVLTARALNPGLRIISRAVQPESVPKLRHAGADKIISPDQIGGHRMAMAILKPSAIELMETLFAPHNLEIQMEELRISEKSPMANKPIRDFFGNGAHEAMLIAIIRASGVKLNPGNDETILPDDVLVLIGSNENLKVVEALAI